MTHDLLFLLPIAFITGAVNTVVGGGGLIQVPGLCGVSVMSIVPSSSMHLIVVVILAAMLKS